MAKDTNFFDLLEWRLKSAIRVGSPARVVSFNSSTRTADIELLFLTKYADGDTESQPIIEDVPVIGMRYKSSLSDSSEMFYPSLQSGDRVWVNFADRALDNMDGINKFDPDYYRAHDIRDAVIVGIL